MQRHAREYALESNVQKAQHQAKHKRGNARSELCVIEPKYRRRNYSAPPHSPAFRKCREQKTPEQGFFKNRWQEHQIYKLQPSVNRRGPGKISWLGLIGIKARNNELHQ